MTAALGLCRPFSELLNRVKITPPINLCHDIQSDFKIERDLIKMVAKTNAGPMHVDKWSS
jgi:hypothetical protein